MRTSLPRRPHPIQPRCRSYALCMKRNVTLSKLILKDAGERYVRAALIASSRFSHVPQLERTDTKPLDLTARDKATGVVIWHLRQEPSRMAPSRRSSSQTD